ncbi:2-oxo-4-hydroxy-4-carboxy-5-ureidoimidazoline decarboxylase [Amycolatopsis australiensis]|uniref:2-oxo-4-hydroxy-4-carboxy-5-ureidoimidazoline decarboxylase n=1 Tax=Amycolatopsis australiensis TaxID=546364 RepID=A0A1K1T3M3_9PSEU|nr:2-oxo-4-hydroxy-4-carboxy-5-ureidoimidazoline decarboxylase [Amycolatopsis australiensis]SFW91241.1 2-oxo-4-hydroxy-4-carboxy-5-ureidoimidazoline decarboxylase [Amycolatopsis australiensis]
MPLTLTDFNTAAAADIRPVLTACLAVPRWVDAVVDGRPYADLDSLKAAADLPLRDDEIRLAMAAHPRIGEKPAQQGTEADWSRNEQSGVDNAGAFAAANAEYEAKFGHVYLVCASGRSGDELLEILKSRLDNDPATELAVAGRELLKIAALRLAKAVTA